MGLRLHGGPDALGVPPWDFSTNANACGPEPLALRAVQQADATRYPDPGYTVLRQALGTLHGVPAHRIVVAASASEFIARMTAAIARLRPQAGVHSPQSGYGDYAAAARSLGLPLTASASQANLVWHTEPGSPQGESLPLPAMRADAVVVIDRAYAPLRLEGTEPPWPASAWQLWSPNKALGLTGVRGAYAVAPEPVSAEVRALLDAVTALAASWPLGAHGVAMLTAWAQTEVQAWVRGSLAALREWKRLQIDAVQALGWTCRPSVTPFFVARWSDEAPSPAVLLPQLRAQGLKLRDAASLGLPGWVRLSVQPPEVQAMLVTALTELEPQA